MADRASVRDARTPLPRPESRESFPATDLAGRVEEFAPGKRLGFRISNGYEAERAEDNRFREQRGASGIRACAAPSVSAVGECAMTIHDSSLGRRSCERPARARSGVSELVRGTRELGATRFLLPSWKPRVKQPRTRARRTESIQKRVPRVAAYEVTLGLEMEITGEAYAAVIRGMGTRACGAYYDTGQPTAKGWVTIATAIYPLLPVCSKPCI